MGTALEIKWIKWRIVPKMSKDTYNPHGFVFETRDGILDYLVKTTGTIMSDIDGIVVKKGLAKCQINQLGGYAHYLVYTAICTAEKNSNCSVLYHDEYRKLICKAHAETPESVSIVEDYYEKSRKFYSLIISENSGSFDAYVKLSDAFIDIAYEELVKDIKLRNRLIQSLAEYVNENYPRFIWGLSKALPKIKSDAIL